MGKKQWCLTLQQERSIASVHFGVTADVPAGAPADTVGCAVGVALETQAAPKQLQQLWIRRSVWLVTGGASVRQPANVGIMLHTERSFYFRMTLQTWVIAGTLQSPADSIRFVRIVAVGALHSPLQHGMVGVAAEFCIPLLVTGKTKFRRVLLQQGILRGGFMDVMALVAGNIVLPVRGGSPFQRLRGGTMAWQTLLDDLV